MTNMLSKRERGNDLGPVLKLRWSQSQGRLRMRSPFTLLGPTAWRMWGRPEGGLPGKESSGTLTISEDEEAKEGFFPGANSNQSVVESCPRQGKTG